MVRMKLTETRACIKMYWNYIYYIFKDVPLIELFLFLFWDVTWWRKR